MSESKSIQIRRGFEVLGGFEFDLGVPIAVGRDPGSGIVLNARDVSRRHAEITFDSRLVNIADFSQNGIFSNGRRISPEASLEHGAAIDIGPFTLILGEARQEARAAINEVRRDILNRLIEHVDLEAIDLRSPDLRPRIEASLERIAEERGIPDGVDMVQLIKELADEALGLGPLELLIEDDDVTEIMVVDPSTIYAERKGRLEKTDLRFTSESAVRIVIDRIIAPIGRRVDEMSPMVDARLEDGSRVNAIIPPLAIRGAAITIRKFAKSPLGVEDLIRFGSLTRDMADMLQRAVVAKANIVISGGTGSGKTTLLGALAGAIPEAERIVTIEDAAELRLPQDHVVSLESRPANNEGKGMVTIRDLVRNALRMRPDRIVVGECRGGEALDMLQAMNTGHDGSLTTLHANSPAEAISRLETLSLMAGIDLPARAIRDQIAHAIDIIVQQTRLSDGSRRITSITEVSDMEDDGTIRLNELFRHLPSGEFLATGWMPSCIPMPTDAEPLSPEGAVEA